MQQSRLGRKEAFGSMCKVTITISRPELTEEERARRMKRIEDAARELLIAVEKIEKEKKNGK